MGGSGTLVANTVGTGNVAVGYEALGTATGTSFQTAVGYQALRMNTSGVSNTALGYSALFSNTT